jgi:type IV secretion system protein TrbL
MGWVSFFENFIQIAVLLFAWVLVILAFFILSIQLFITLIEFKLATLCGFVLLPFGLFGKTAFMAERVLGLVISSGIKVLVLAVIVGIGSTLFDEFRAGFGGAQPSIEDALAVALASLCLLGLGIFGPSIANGIVSGGPALGAGAAAGTVLAAGGALAGGAAAARLGVGAAAGAVGGAARGAAFTSGAANSAYALGSAGKTGAAAIAGGAGGVGQAAVGAAMSPLRKAAASLKDSYRSGGRAAVTATGGTISGGSSAPSPDAPAGAPAWASAMKNRQTMTHGATIAAHTLRSGDGGGSGASVDISQKD